MDLKFNTKLSKTYKSPTQIARVLTEDWVLRNGYCPSCGHDKLTDFPNNKPVADFFCSACSEEFELKSKNGKSLGNKIADGAHSTMIRRINAPTSPHFFFLGYNKLDWSVNNLMIIPNSFFVPQIIEKRKPLSPTAKRAGWTGCNIEISKIPSYGQIFLVKNAELVPKANVLNKWKAVSYRKKLKEDERGWYFDILNCLDRIPNERFSLNEMYAFEQLLKAKHPKNNNIRAKIRQQLQDLRDNNVIEFLSKGNYRKIQL